MAGLEQAGGAAQGGGSDRLGAFDALFGGDSVAPTHSRPAPESVTKRQAKTTTASGKPKRLAKSKDPDRTSCTNYLPIEQSAALDLLVARFKSAGVQADRSDLIELSLNWLLSQMKDVELQQLEKAFTKLKKKAQPPA